MASSYLWIAMFSSCATTAIAAPVAVNTPALCTPTLTTTWLGSDRPQVWPWRVGEPLQARVVCSAQPATFSLDGEVIAEGQFAATAVATSEGAHQIRACGRFGCLENTVAATEPAVKLVLHSVTTLKQQRAGRLVRVRAELRGSAKHQVAAVLVFTHSDGFAATGKPLRVVGGYVSADVFVAKDVDRVVMMPVPAGFRVATLSGCTAQHCAGQIEAVEQRIVPFAPVWIRSHLSVATGVSTLTDPLLANLEARLSRMPIAGAYLPAALVRSDLERELAYTTDQALFALAMLRAGERRGAERVLNALANLQNGDGSFAFAYTQSGGIARVNTDERFASGVAWATLAFATHGRLYRSRQYSTALGRGLDYLGSQVASFGGWPALRMNPTDVAGTAWNESQVTAFAHNAEAIAALRTALSFAPRSQDAALLQGLESFAAMMWNGKEYEAGFHSVRGSQQRLEDFFDARTLGTPSALAQRMNAPVASMAAVAWRYFADNKANPLHAATW